LVLIPGKRSHFSERDMEESAWIYRVVGQPFAWVGAMLSGLRLKIALLRLR
jgi:hypothetical protein